MSHGHRREKIALWRKIKAVYDGNVSPRLHPVPPASTVIRAKWKAGQLRVCPRCDYCDIKVDRMTATVDHITPSARNGEDKPHNWALACIKCNARKGNRHPAECGMSLRRVRDTI